jgi:membrane-bound metal-dependent hydrolase YbcI (DUF457 family)
MSWAAHELESYVIQRHTKVKVSYLAILLGCLGPDLATKFPVYGLRIGGFRFRAVSQPWQYHRGWPGVGFTHTLIFAIVVAVFVLWKFQSREWALGLLLGVAAHVFTDMFDSVGTMLFFPFTTQHYTTGMWAYAAQQGRYGDAAAYYSSLGGVWDTLWLVVAIAHWRVLKGDYFFSVVMPVDPAWAWLRRKFGMSDRAMLALYRSYFVYGASRIFAWFLWARLIDKAPLDLSWGGPDWINKAPGQHETVLTVLRNTAIGVTGFAVLTWLIWRYLWLPLWRRATPATAANPLPA